MRQNQAANICPNISLGGTPEVLLPAAVAVHLLPELPQGASPGLPFIIGDCDCVG